MSRSVPALVRTALVVAFLAVFATAGLQTAAVSRDARPVPPPPTQPTSADQIQNVDQVKTAIKAYYGDTVDGTTPFGTPNHVPSATGAYAQEMAGLERSALRYLAHPGHSPATRAHGAAKRAILLDVDDTSLNTYNYEIYSGFVYDPVANGRFVDSAAFPGVPGMAALTRAAQKQGYTVFFLTGRPEAQRAGTEKNLADAGFATDSAHVFLKDETQPWITCDTTGDGKCTTVERKSATRAHIEKDLGYDIVANFGDQYSDLKGGYADQVYKLPNPMYYLP